MSAPRRAVFLNRSYWPDETATAQLLTDLAEGLAARGRHVTVIASQPRVSRAAREMRHGVTILRVGSTRSKGEAAGAAPESLAAKARAFFSYYVLGLATLLRALRRGDAVVALTDPPLIGVGAAVVAGLKGAQLYHWVQDIYPEVAELLSGYRVLGLLRGWRDDAWQRAAGCVTLGTDMGAVLLAGGVPPGQLRLWPNWAPAGLRPPAPADIARVRATWGVPEAFVIGYSGNLGRVHDLDAIVELADALRGDRQVWFVLVGGGPQRARIEAAAAQRGLGQIRFLPPAPRADLAASLAAADLQLVTLLPGCERCVFPSKLYGVAAVGRPVLFIGQRHSEIAQLVAREGLGGAFDRGDLAAAAAAVRAFQASPALWHAAQARALQFAASTPGGSSSAAAWDQWLFPGPAIDLPSSPAQTALLPAS